ncbi:MAG: ABC transporter permease [Gammaproteobacteria bacterium]|nr:ABC transporter permease [Gammaproteobacteria bacterium]
MGLMWANLFRRKTRTFLTLFSLLVAFLLFVLLRAVAAPFAGGGVSVDGADRLVVTSKYSIIDLLPLSQLAEIQRVPGVEAVTHQTWFGGNYQDPANFFPKYPVEPRAYFDMYPEFAIDPAQLDAFESTRTGIVVEEGMLARFGWSIGDRIPIEGDIWALKDGSRLWQFDLVGTYRHRDPGEGAPVALLMHYDYFDEARSFEEGAVGWYTVRVSDPEQAPAISGAIDALFENSPSPTKTSTEAEFARSFAAQIGDIALMATGILSAVFFTILLLTANTMSQSLRERIPELAVLKTVGFSDARTSLLVVGESVLLCVLGALLGVGLGALLLPVASVATQQFMGPVSMSLDILLQSVAFAVALGLVVGALPALTAQRLRIVEALRRG